ncbi:hypothetical protein PLESTF_001335600 [Pleodorina starrii]|nr:hypothetical protein PLESTF_001335600 [Pleodorina starrii]
MNPVEPKQRSPTQFHWDNNGYDTFEDILGDLKHSKRKRIRQKAPSPKLLSEAGQAAAQNQGPADTPRGGGGGETHACR